MKELDWLIKNQKFVSLSAIGEAIGAKDQLLKAVNGSRKLPKKHNKKLSKILKALQKPTCEGK